MRIAVDVVVKMIELSLLTRRVHCISIYTVSSRVLHILHASIPVTIGMHDEIFHFEVFKNFMEILKYFKTPSLKYFMKFLIFIIKWLKTLKNMIKVYEVSRKYIMTVMTAVMTYSYVYHLRNLRPANLLRTQRQTDGRTDRQTFRRWLVQGLHSRLCWRPVKGKLIFRHWEKISESVFEIDVDWLQDREATTFKIRVK